MRATIDRAGVRELSESPSMVRALRAPAREVLRLAVTSAPFQTGAYKASLAVRDGTGLVYVLANDRKANFLEYGTRIPTPHFDVLSRAVRRAGFKRVVFMPHVRKGRRGK